MSKRQLLDFQPDIIHIAVPDLLGLAALKLAQQHDIPAVASYHTRYETYLRHYWYLAWLEEPLTRYLRWFYGRMPRSLCAVGLDARGAAGRRPARTISSPGRAASTRRASIRTSAAPPGARAMASAPRRLVILHVSRLVREKRLDTLTAALSRITVPHRAVIVGDGPDRGFVERALPHAIFTGFLDGEDLAAAYASSRHFRLSQRQRKLRQCHPGSDGVRPALRLRRCHRQPLAGGGRARPAIWRLPTMPSDFAGHITALVQRSRLAPAHGRGGAGARPDLFLGRDHGADAGLLSRAAGGACAVKIVDVCEFYSPTGGGVRRYINQKLELAAALRP